MTIRVIAPEVIEAKILILRGEKVMLDSDLAVLYGVTVSALIQAAKRNADRFPGDFMFQLTWNESSAALRSQSVILKQGEHLKYRRYAFTEQGVAMLSSVLRSPRAVQVNIEIMRTFVRLREMLTSNVALSRKLNALEKKYDAQFRVVFDAIRALMKPAPAKRKKIGFVNEEG